MGIVAGVAVVEAAASARGVPAWVVPRYRCVLWVGLVISDCFSGSQPVFVYSISVPVCAAVPERKYGVSLGRVGLL